MLPRPRRTHDQLLRPLVAGVGGALLGHIVWLLGISLARRAPLVSTAVLAISVLFLLASAGVGYLAWQRYQRGEMTTAAFLAGLTFSPVVFTVIVLGVTYL